MLINLPAAVLIAPLAKRGIQTSNTEGSIWHGQVGGLRVGVLNLGNAEWRLRFLPLFIGQLAADVKLTQPNGYAEARVSAALTGRLTLSNVSASMPVQSILGTGGLPGGWVGTAQVKFSELVLKGGWPIAAHGTLDMIDLTGPAQQASNIGAYRLQFPAANATADALTGSLTSLESAAIDVAGTLKFNSDRSYQLDAQVAARANTPPNIAQGMQILGAPDARGRRPFSVSGTL
jgi:hypothetical protein